MKNLITLIFMAFLASSCGSVLKDDIVKWDDASAKYQSVFTIVGQESNLGPAVYQVGKNDDTLKILTLLTGTYEVRSDSCSFLETGRYAKNEVIEFPLSKFHNSAEEKLCLVTIQVSPEFESTVAIFPRFSIVYLQFTNRGIISSKGFQFPKGFNAGRLADIGTVDRYRLIQNCVDAEPKMLKESLSPAVATVDFAELKQSEISNCYYSLVYTLNGAQGRHAFTVNIYNKEHSPLSANVIVNKSTVSVSSNSSVSVCAVGSKSKNGSKCSNKLSNLSNPYVIQVHTNKRSYYEMRKK